MKEALGRRLARALAVRRARFEPTIRFSAPAFKHYRAEAFERARETVDQGPRFAAISVTGGACALGCEHCRGALLRSMKAVGSPEALRALVERLHARGCRGLLTSGGCDAAGSIPLAPFLPVLGELRRELGLSIAVHVGPADGAALAPALAAAGVDRVMLDLVGDAATAREVLHVEQTPASFEANLAALCDAGLAVAPHVVVGLHGGRLRGELRAVELAARHPVAEVVLVVLRPEPGTPYAGIDGPEPVAVAGLMADARLALPETPLHLGCARPLGPAGREIERFAIKAGLDGVAFPDDFTIRLARSLGLEPIFAEQCCALPATA